MCSKWAQLLCGKLFFPRGSGRRCLEMAQIAPHRALTPLSTDCSVWLQIESGHALDFVSFCQTVLKTMASLRQNLCLERLLLPKDPSGEQISRLSQFLHDKYQTQRPWMIGHRTHSSHLTVVVHVMDQSRFGATMALSNVIQLTEGRVCVCVCVCLCLSACRALQKWFATVKCENIIFFGLLYVYISDDLHIISKLWFSAVILIKKKIKQTLLSRPNKTGSWK